MIKKTALDLMYESELCAWETSESALDTFGLSMLFITRLEGADGRCGHIDKEFDH